MSKVALVTGTSSGIGLATAVALAKAGFTVVATMRDTSKAQELRDRVKAEGLELDVLPLDITDQASIKTCVDEVIVRHGHIDVLVNNAGAGHVATVEQTTEEDLRRILEVDFFGVWHMIRAVVPHLRAAGSGRIISLSSVGGIVGQPFNDAYCAAKFAVEGMSEALAPVLRELGIFISLIEPGAVNTKFVETTAPSAMKLMVDETDPYEAVAKLLAVVNTQVRRSHVPLHVLAEVPAHDGDQVHRAQALCEFLPRCRSTGAAHRAPPRRRGRLQLCPRPDKEVLQPHR